MAHGVGVHGPDCHCVVREDYRRTREEFDSLRRGFARREGVPPAVAHSESGVRQWISDELRGRSQPLAAKRRAEGRAHLGVLGNRALVVVWGIVVLVLVVQALTAIGPGWTHVRTAGLVAAVVVAAGLSVVGFAARESGGVFAPVRGVDGRLSTSKSVVALWTLMLVFVFAFFAAQLVDASGGRQRRRLLHSLHGVAFGQLALIAAPLLAAVVAKWITGDKVKRRVLQKLHADRGRPRDLVTDDSGRSSLIDAQYVLVNVVAVAFAAVGLARDPGKLPHVPTTLTAVALVSACAYLAGKLTENDRPVILSVVRVRSRGDIDSSVRQGDDVEVRGLNLAAGGSDEPDLLGRVVVKFGPVHVHAPLVPTDAGFSNPVDTGIVVPVPVEVEPGRVEVRVVTASGVESNIYEIEVAP